MVRTSQRQNQTKTPPPLLGEVSVRTLGSDVASIKDGSEIPQPNIMTPPTIASEPVVEEKKKKAGWIFKLIIWLIVLGTLGYLGYTYAYPYITNVFKPQVF